MYQTKLNELLAVEISDCSDGDSSDVSSQSEGAKNGTLPHYNEILNDILHSKECESVSESAVESPYLSLLAKEKSNALVVERRDSELHKYECLSNASLGNISISISTGSCDNGGIVDARTKEELHDKTHIQSLESCRSGLDVSIQGSEGICEPDTSKDVHDCLCRMKCETLVDHLLEACGPVFQNLRSVVRHQLISSKNIHKVSYILNSGTRKSQHEDKKFDPPADEEENQHYDELTTLESTKLCLESLGISQRHLQSSEKSKLLIRQRHNISKGLTTLGLFRDTIILNDVNTLNVAGINLPSSMSFTCIATNNTFLVAGTSSGSILVGDVYHHNYERHFSPNEENDEPKEAYNEETLSWIEIDKHEDNSVTFVDVLSGANWIVVGYGDGRVKLLQINKTTAHGKLFEASKTGGTEGASAPEQTNHSRGFGLMADAVSSAFGGLKKSGSYALCSAKVFMDAVMLCKFTIVDSHEEIICANSKSVAILSYSKTVLSHNLAVNMLSNFNANVLVGDEIVDVSCLRSNPQAKYISGMNVGGLVAIITRTKCVVISTKPDVSVLFKVPFNDYYKKLPVDTKALPPSATWMVLNNSGDIKPLLLIMLTNRLSFTLCDMVMRKSGSPTAVCTNVGYIKFGVAVRNIRIVSRDIVAAIDANNTMSLFQVNVFNNVMYYDILRSFDLSASGPKHDLWEGMANLSSVVSVQTRIVKLVANSYKKFSALVAELFGAKRNELFFELRVVCLYILTKEGIWSCELHSWIKAIGELTLKKRFSEALAICNALHQGLVPGLLDYKAYVENIQKLILYVIHQSSAHIIRLSKLMDNTCISIVDDTDEEWPDNVKLDIMSQINRLCCSMFDVCIALDMHESLNELVYRCFATLKHENIFVKYVLLNYFDGRLDLTKLRPEIFEAILDLYDTALDYIYNECLETTEGVEDCIVRVRDAIEAKNNDKCIVPISDNNLKVEEHVLIYEILCNNLSYLYTFCSRSEIPLSREKAVCRLSKHAQWHCFVYCSELIGNDIHLALDILSSEASNKLGAMRTGVKQSPGGEADILCDSENLFVVRVLYSVLNSCLTLENCGMNSETTLSTFCKVFAYITSRGSFKPSFPLKANHSYARSELEYEDEAIDLDNMERLTLRTTFNGDSEPCALQMLMSTSPRLLFTCLANLFLRSQSNFEDYSDFLGSKIDVFNFILDALISCMNSLEEHQSTFIIRQMLSTLIIAASVFTDSLFLDLRTQVVAVYTLITESGHLECDGFVDTEPASTTELILEDGSFNVRYYLNNFRKKSDDLFENVRQFNISIETTKALVKMHIRKCLQAIYQKYDCQTSWTKNAHFANMKRFCSELTNLVSDVGTRLFLCEAIGDYDKVIAAYESLGRDKLFTYLKVCINCIKEDSPDVECTVNQLLFRDPAMQKEFLKVLMNSIPMLIGVDIKSSTDLLVEIFSLPKIAYIFSDPDLQFSQDIVLSTLKGFPELQLMVLNALLAMEQGSSQTDGYFTQYLRLLAEHDKKSMCTILKRQKALNIKSCLDICMSAHIYDAVAYLLMRAGDFEGAANWILKAFKLYAHDLEMCQRLVEDAQYMCKNFEQHITYDTLERLWFGILSCVVMDVTDEKAAVLIEMVFNVGILKFTKHTHALLELEKYESVKVARFKSSLETLLHDLDCQTFMVKEASNMSNIVLNREFRRGIDYNRQGIVVEIQQGSQDEQMYCLICNRETIPALELESDDEREQLPANTNRKNAPSPSADTAMRNISPFEQHLGILYTLISLADKGSGTDSENRASTYHLTNLYNDRLSAFVNKKQWVSSNRVPWNLAASGLASQFVPAIEKQLGGDRINQSINVFWCGHIFHVTCAPHRCPICSSD